MREITEKRTEIKNKEELERIRYEKNRQISVYMYIEQIDGLPYLLFLFIYSLFIVAPSIVRSTPCV